MLQLFGKYLIIIGLLAVLAGVVLIAAGKIPYVGRLPGDILIKRENFTFYFPITTSVIVSLILSVIMYFFFKR